MKSLIRNYVPILPAAFLLCAGFPSAKAQVLPNVQSVSVLAPPNVKTDGKLSEWGGRFEAFNKQTALFYTLANDNERLYIIIRAVDTATTSKLLNGWLTLVITSAEKDNKVTPLSINYLSNIRDPGSIAKIKIAGFIGIPDSVLSADNTQGVSMGSSGDQKSFTYELALSLKYLIPVINDYGTFCYSIILKNDTAGKQFLSGKYRLVRE